MSNDIKTLCEKCGGAITGNCFYEDKPKNKEGVKRIKVCLPCYLKRLVDLAYNAQNMLRFSVDIALDSMDNGFNKCLIDLGWTPPDKTEARLLNAFQLIKNGRTIGYLKFDEFKKLLDKEHDYKGLIVK